MLESNGRTCGVLRSARREEDLATGKLQQPCTFSTGIASLSAISSSVGSRPRRTDPRSASRDSDTVPPRHRSRRASYGLRDEALQIILFECELHHIARPIPKLFVERGRPRGEMSA